MNLSLLNISVDPSKRVKSNYFTATVCVDGVPSFLAHDNGRGLALVYKPMPNTDPKAAQEVINRCRYWARGLPPIMPKPGDDFQKVIKMHLDLVILELLGKVYPLNIGITGLHTSDGNGKLPYCTGIVNIGNEPAFTFGRDLNAERGWCIPLKQGDWTQIERATIHAKIMNPYAQYPLDDLLLGIAKPQIFSKRFEVEIPGNAYGIEAGTYYMEEIADLIRLWISDSRVIEFLAEVLEAGNIVQVAR